MLESDCFVEYDGGQVLVRLLVFLCRMLQDINAIQSNRLVNSSGILDPDSLQVHAHV